MKNSILLFFGLATSLSGFADEVLPSTTLFQYEGSRDLWCLFDHAVDGKDVYNVVSEMVNRTDHTADMQYTIFDENFNIYDSFTVKGICKFEKREGNDYYSQTTEEASPAVLGYDMPDILLTKGVFSHDNKWCVLVRNRYENQEILTVYNQDSEKVGDIKLDSQNGNVAIPYFVYGKPSVASLGKVYLACGLDLPRNYYRTTIYSFDGQNGLREPIKKQNIIAWPNPLPKGSDLTIELGREVPDGTFVTFSDMHGRMIEKAPVSTGSNSIVVSPRSISRGAYIYTVFYGDKTVESGKILAE